MDILIAGVLGVSLGIVLASFLTPAVRVMPFIAALVLALATFVFLMRTAGSGAPMVSFMASFVITRYVAEVVIWKRLLSADRFTIRSIIWWMFRYPSLLRNTWQNAHN